MQQQLGYKLIQGFRKFFCCSPPIQEEIEVKTFSQVMNQDDFILDEFVQNFKGNDFENFKNKMHEFFPKIQNSQIQKIFQNMTLDQLVKKIFQLDSFDNKEKQILVDIITFLFFKQKILDQNFWIFIEKEQDYDFDKFIVNGVKNNEQMRNFLDLIMRLKTIDVDLRELFWQQYLGVFEKLFYITLIILFQITTHLDEISNENNLKLLISISNEFQSINKIFINTCLNIKLDRDDWDHFQDINSQFLAPLNSNLEVYQNLLHKQDKDLYALFKMVNDLLKLALQSDQDYLGHLRKSLKKMEKRLNQVKKEEFRKQEQLIGSPSDKTLEKNFKKNLDDGDDSYFCDSWVMTEKKQLSTIKEMDSFYEKPSIQTND